MEENANRTNMFFVNERWLGGTLTNFRTIKRRVSDLDRFEKMEVAAIDLYVNEYMAQYSWAEFVPHMDFM